LFHRKAQNIGEYAIVIAIVGSALVAMQSYLQRSVQGLIKLSIDEIGQQDTEDLNATEFIKQSNTLISYAEDTTTQDDIINTSIESGKTVISRQSRIEVRPIAGSDRGSISFSGSALKDLSE